MASYGATAQGNSEVSMSSAKAADNGDFEVSGLRIERSDNGGFIVSKDLRKKPSAKKGKGEDIGPGWMEPKKEVYENLDGVLGCVNETFGAEGAAAEGDEGDGYESES